MSELLRPTRREVLIYGATAAAMLSLGPLIEACGGSSSPTVAKGGTLKFGVGDGQAKDTFDPARVITAMPNVGGGMLYDTLLKMDVNWKLTPALASDFSFSSDLKTWTFKIRNGVQFHSGKTLSSSDVSAQFIRVLDKATGSSGRGVIGPVLDPSGITTPDASTIVFSLKVPDAFFGVKVAHYTLHIPQAGITDWINGAIGTGPFKLKSFQPGTGFQFIKNPNYWQSGKPYLDGINCVNIPDQATKAQAVLTGDVDVATDLPAATLDQFTSSTTAQLLDLQSYSPYLFDVDGSIKPYSDPRVSKAMKMLIDRKKMLDIVVHGRGLVSADTLIAPTDPFYPSDLQPFPFDPEQAKSLLASAGYATGFKDNIWTTTAYPYLDEGAAYGKQAWAAANLDMTIQSTDNDTYIAAFLVKPIVMDYGLRLHPVTMLEQYAASASGSNLSRLKDAQVDTLLTQVKSTADVSKQKQIMGELIHRYNDVSAEINPFHFSNLWPIKKRAKGIIIDPMTVIDFREATLG
jgi:peptide/nickel transport system substrate-binding protein